MGVSAGRACRDLCGCGSRQARSAGVARSVRVFPRVEPVETCDAGAGSRQARSAGGSSTCGCFRRSGLSRPQRVWISTGSISGGGSTSGCFRRSSLSRPSAGVETSVGVDLDRLDQRGWLDQRVFPPVEPVETSAGVSSSIGGACGSRQARSAGGSISDRLDQRGWLDQRGFRDLSGAQVPHYSRFTISISFTVGSRMYGTVTPVAS